MHLISAGHKGQKSSFSRIASAGAMCGLLLFGQTVPLMGNPTGGAVVAGSATIGAAGPTLTINQSTQNAIINWQTFSIANGETTKFIVPNSSSATLNRVVGGNPSAIYGNLQSNGILYLVNTNGIVVGPSGQINTASFLASTLDVSNEQFLAGGAQDFSGSSGAAINNSGVIHASSGDVYLIADQVNNSGTISAKKGAVGLAAGSDVLFQPAGNDHLFVQATPAGTTRATGVTNSGTIRAAAAELKAAGGNAYALAINNTGVIAATGYKKVNGQVYLTSDGGSISNGGTISAKQANGNGGKIVLNGTAKKSTTSGTVTNSGTLNASATVAKGAGGTITVKNMSGTTINTASGQILAAGGTGGAGGKIETSGKSLGIDGAVSAGKGGSWLLDPTDVTIDTGSGVAPDVNVNTLSNALNGGTSETVQANGSTDSGNIDLNTTLTWTSTATLTLEATGNINLNDPLSATTGTLNLTAGGTISDTAFLSVSSFILTNGSWVQNSSTLPSFNVGNDFEIQGGTFLRVAGGNGSNSPYLIEDVYGLEGIGSPSGNLLSDKFALLTQINAGNTFSWNGNQGFMPIGNGSSVFAGTLDGQGFAISGLSIDMASANDIGLFGETVVGANITNVSLNVSITGNSNVGGLVGVNNGGAISDVNVSGNVTGNTSSGTQVGGIVGANNSGSLSNVFNSASVAGGSHVGGVAGYNNDLIAKAVNVGQVNADGSSDGGVVGYDDGSATVTDSWNTGAIFGGGVNVGGLIGYNRGTVSASYNLGSVASAAGSVGGLAGENDNSGSSPALIENSYSTGAVTATPGNAEGGLVGENFGTITDSYSSGLVTGSSFSGGLTAFDGGSAGIVTGSFWDLDTSGQSTSAGAELGETTSALLTLSTYTGAGWNIGTSLGDTWVIFDGQTRPMLAMEYSTTITNAHQLQLVDLNATTQGANYSVGGNIDASGTTNAADIWGTSTTNGGAGFVPIGTFPSGSYSGTFNGQGNAINGLYINSGLSDFVGLFGDIGGGTVENLGVTNALVIAPSSQSVGILAGAISGGLVTNSYATGTVSGFSDVGGLVGQNVGNITFSYSDAAVTGSIQAGGLAGDNNGSIANAYSTGTVLGPNGTTGGLVGLNQGSITTAYSSSTVTSSGEDVGGLVGQELGGSTVTDGLWDTDSSGVTLGVGSDPTNTTPGVIAATTAQLQSQTFIAANAPSFNFSTAWNTSGGTLTPQLTGLPETPLPSNSSGGNSVMDTLSGIAYSDAAGTVPDTGTGLIELIFDGSVIGSTTVDGQGDFSFSVSSIDVTGGLLLTDTNAGGGNTFYQSNAGGSAIQVNTYGGTLTVIADTASNSALKSVIAGLTGPNNIIYSVSSANVLTANAGVGMNIASNYTFDGNITVSGPLTTSNDSNLTTTKAVTLTGGTVSLSGNLASTDAVNVISTAGDLYVDDLGSSDGAATAGSMTLTSAGAVSISNSYIVLNGGDFTATGSGSVTDQNGIDIYNTVIDTEGGNINLTGQAIASFFAQLDDFTAGVGVSVDQSTLETTSGGEDAPTGGNITIMGNGSVTHSVENGLTGVLVEDSTVTVENGALQITGTVSSGTTSSSSNAVFIFNDAFNESILPAIQSADFSEGEGEGEGNVIAANGSGSITINGNAAGSTSTEFNDGVNLGNATIEVVNGAAGISITGTGGNFANTSTSNSVGVSVFNGTLITASGSAPITIHGTGGIDTLGDADGYSGGILVSGDDEQPTLISSTSGTVSLTGVGGVSTEFSFGIDLTGDGEDPGAAVISSTSGAITLTGSLTASANPSLFPQAIVIQSNGLVTTETGALTLTGTVTGSVADNASAEQATGVIIRGGGEVDATGTTGTVAITGVTTGALATGANYGVQFDDAEISTAGGALTIMGMVGNVTNSTDSEGIFLTDDTIVSAVNAPITLTGTVSAGASASGGFVAGVQILNGSVMATGTGSISITGNALGSTGSGEDVGLYASGAAISAQNASGSAVSGITITGAAGNLANETQNAGSVGLYLYQATSITASGTAPITLTGRGGTDTNTVASLNTFSAGIFDSDQNDDEMNLISTTSGAISVTGTGGVSPNLTMGLNLYGPSGGSVVIASTSGAITLEGTMSTAANPTVSLFGTFLEVGSTVTTESGAISITGLAPVGSASVGSSAQANGLLMEDNTVSVTGNGSILLTGTATSVSGNNQIGGLLMIDSDISAAQGNITFNGADSSTSTVGDELFGIVMRGASTVLAQDGAISLTGTVSAGTAGLRDFGVRVSEGSTITALGENGNVTVLGSTVGSTGNGFTTGVIVEGSGSALSADGTLMVTGHAGALAGTTGAILDPSGDDVFYNPATNGITVSEGGSLVTTGSGAMTLIGTGGANLNADPTSGSSGVAIFSPVGDGTSNLSAGGNLFVTGTAGSSASAGIGVLIGGPSSLGEVSITASDAASITGTGGAGNVAGSALPNAGIYDNPGPGSSFVSASGGDLNFTGTSGGGSPSIGLLFGTDGESSASLSSSGTVNITSNGGVISYDADAEADSLAFTAPAGANSMLTSLGDNTVSLVGGDYTLDLTASVNLGTVSAAGLTIDANESSVSLGMTSVGDLVINGADAVTQSGPITVSMLTIANADSVTLMNAANNITSLGDIISDGAINIFTDPGLTLTGTVSSSEAITIAETGGNLTLGSGAQVIETGGSNIILAAGTNLANSHYIINNSTAGASAIQSGDGVYYLYSSDPTYDSLGAITIDPANMEYGATYPTSSNNFDNSGNAAFFFVAALGDVGPNVPVISMPPPSTSTGGAAGGGSNIVPPALTPQPTQTNPQTTSYNPTSGGDDGSGNGLQPPPFSFVGSGISQLLGQMDGGLANSASNSGLVGTGDIAQLNDGQLNSAGNPHAADSLEQALGPIVYQNLADALKALGDWADVPDESSNSASDREGETILTGGDVAEMSATGVKNIPLGKAPEELRNAMNSPALQGAGSGH
jgi:filamentous hemagglutinin family protein